MSTPAAVHTRIRDAIEAHAPRFRDVSNGIFETPELAFEEHHAAARLTSLLEDAGFALERGLAGMDTAFRATWGDPARGPTVAILCEYDALRGLGHACGHNLIGTGGAAAGVALRHAVPDLPGCLQVIGTPAEEDGGGKIILVQHGIFEDVDAAIMYHPSSGVSKAHRGGLAAQEFRVRYHGRPAHAAAAPWDGVNALDALIQFFVGVGLLRQQLRPDARIHGVIRHGGDAANVIPDLTEAEFLARAERAPYLQDVMKRLEALAEAAARASGCTHDFETGVLYENRINNMTIARTFERHLNALGEPTEEPDPAAGVGSSDIGNVSRVCPAIHPYVSISPDPISGHTEAFRDASGSDHGFLQMLKAANAMASTAADLLHDRALLQRARQEWQEALERGD